MTPAQERGARVRVQAGSGEWRVGRSATFIDLFSQSLGVMESLVRHSLTRPDSSLLSQTGATALIVAGEFGHAEVAIVLLDRGANLKAMAHVRSLGAGLGARFQSDEPQACVEALGEAKACRWPGGSHFRHCAEFIKHHGTFLLVAFGRSVATRSRNYAKQKLASRLWPLPNVCSAGSGAGN